MFRGKSIAIDAYISTEERSQINNLSFHFKTLEKEAQTKLKARKKEVKIRTEMNEVEDKKTTEKINETKRSLKSSTITKCENFK